MHKRVYVVLLEPHTLVGVITSKQCPKSLMPVVVPLHTYYEITCWVKTPEYLVLCTARAHRCNGTAGL